VSETFVTKSFGKYREERCSKKIKECPTCSDLWHGYHDGFHDGQKEKQKKIDELRESLKVCQRDYNSMIRLLNGLDNIAVRDCIGRMNLRKAMFKKSLEEREVQGE